MPKDVYTLDDLREWHDATKDAQPPIRLSVFGDPVAHSASPPMQNAALEKCGIDAQYARLHILSDQLETALRLLVRDNFIGANVTIPHKAAALAVMDELDEQTRKI